MTMNNIPDLTQHEKTHKLQDLLREIEMLPCCTYLVVSTTTLCCRVESGWLAETCRGDLGPLPLAPRQRAGNNVRWRQP